MNRLNGLQLALVGPLPPPAGGMANQTRQLAELLGGEGVEVRVVQTNAPYRPAWTARLPVLRAAVRLLPYLVRLWAVAGRSQLVHVMANSGWSWHLFAAPAIRIASQRGVPAIVNYRGGEAASFMARSHRSVRRTMERAAAVVVPSEYLRQVFAAYGIHAEVVPNVVDLNCFRPSVPSRTRGAHLVVTRNLEPIYDNATAIRALALVRARLPSARLTIAGSGPERRALEALAAALGVAAAVTFTGRLEREAVAALYRDADVALNPSTVDNMPNSLLEALASGVPIVSTDVGGVPHIVQDGTTALLVPPRDPEAMARAALRLLENPELSARLAAAGLQQARRYTWNEVAPLIADLYARVMTTTARHTP